ncbi:cysteinyl-tRNA synthetase [Desulfitobacterium dichloroeliminans LMG P-21439]|uniref:Cysteine--tRNA ligase n=1 Tax=Desulfitobacterium dichloroeliminans (strain LMG P-21439 / DCA1) TaxID=871963 RepID=L0F465_DESDL|nr:cysteine--tRNA ligase [Desulfitobacterium dichloroeliminans]AGA67957.1 cysteinyl-tRNA synthetase [Desulfitobacterium dichloroeliminans LMG P-21439]
MPLRLFNTMSHQKEEFKPREKGKVAMYTCGPTVYNYFHVGNGRMLVVFDMIRRYLMYKGYDVTFVQNFTDIDDKIINRGNEEGIDPLELAQKYIEEYFKDAKALNLMTATIHPKATDHIPEMIEIIKGLEESGLAYAVEGDVYFAVDKLPDYGKLSGRNFEDMQAGARVEVEERKHNPMDFALWKSAKPGEPFWESPWGKGRPGWHIECTAMSLKYLGAGFDIHGGGGDLVFPHHENEIAQSEGYLHGETFARYWMHNAFLTINQQKMSKSLGNFFTVREILEHFSGEVIRFYLLGTHYRSPLDFDDENLQMAQKGLERLQTSIRLADEALGRHGEKPADEANDQKLIAAAEEAQREFESAMDDDFNSALAYASLFELGKVINAHVQAYPYGSAGLQKARATLWELADVLGFDLAHPANSAEAGNEKLDQVMDLLLEVRAIARKKKDWEMSDLIRDRLKDLGIVLEDTPQGARWTIK